MLRFKDSYPSCIGCGYCCTKVICHVGVREFGDEALCKDRSCPALVWSSSKKRHYCNLMLGKKGRAYQNDLYVGEGCCSNLNSWRREPLVNRTNPSNERKDVGMQTFSIALRTIRAHRGMTQKEMANRLNTAENYISLLENGKREPSVEFMQTVARYFNVGVSDILRIGENDIFDL